jgi:hypothetical protein
MTHGIRRSPGLLAAPFAGSGAVQDLVGGHTHVLAPLAWWVFCAAPASADDLAADLADVTGRAIAEPRRDVDAGIASLRALGLLDRDARPPLPDPLAWPADPTPDMPAPVLDLFDLPVGIRTRDPEVLALLAADPAFRIGRPSRVVLAERAGAGITVEAAETWEFPTVDGFRVQLPGLLHDLAARTSERLVLHAGGALAPAGDEVVVLAGASASGKSTLTGALVRHGAAPLSDELIGVAADGTVAGVGAAFALDAVSRSVLGLKPADAPHVDVRHLREGADTVGPVALPVRVVLPTYAAGTPAPVLESLGPIDALRGVLPHATNLGRVGDAEFAALCRIVEPGATTLVHGDALTAARRLLRRPRTSDAG